MKLSLRAKAILFFTFGIVLFSALILVTYQNLSYLNAASRGLAEELVEAGLTSKLQISISRIIMPVNDYLIHGSPAEKKNFQQAVEEFEKLLAKLKEHSKEAPREREIYKRIIGPYQSVKNLGAGIMALASPVGHPGGIKRMEEMDAKAGRLIKEVAEFYAYSREEGAELQSAINRRYSFLMVFFIFAGAALIAGTLGSYFIFKHIIIKPILQLNLGTWRVARGNFAERLNIKTGDEIEDLADSFNLMAERLEDLYENLEQKIRERTAELEQTVAELEKARKASLNIMADLHSSKAALEDKVTELNRSRQAMLHILKDIEAGRKETSELYEKLKVVDRMKTEFLSMVSHELRTPITPIKGYLALLLDGKMGTLSSTQQKVLNILNRQSEHLQGLIDSLLDISRLELGKPIPTETRPLSLGKIVEDVIEVEKVSVEGRKIALKLEGAAPLPTIMGDEIKLKRVLTNLIGNATKFTPKGGEIIIRVKPAGPNIRVEVVDNGIGIAREYLEKVFDKFYQVDSSYTRAAGGIGMGLAIARELIELHGGRIWAESEGPGKGSSFIFTLPVIKEGGNQHG